jgi:hypothetical protein
MIRRSRGPACGDATRDRADEPPTVWRMNRFARSEAA